MRAHKRVQHNKVFVDIGPVWLELPSPNLVTLVDRIQMVKRIAPLPTWLITHTHTHIYIYICVCVCVCVLVCVINHMSLVSRPTVSRPTKYAAKSAK